MEYFLGVFISLIVESFKQTVGTSKLGTLIIFFVLSLICGTVFVLFKETPYWETIVQIIITASAFHNLILKRFEKYD